MARTTTGRKSTIYDIAKATGSSTSTVSMVLNGNWARYRISEETATRILDSAKALGYNVNLSARGLRLSRSGLAGMVIPHYRNRFFAGLAETFEDEARRRGLCPIVVGTQRDPDVELNVAQTLLAQRVELLFIAGVRDPAPLNMLCDAAGIPSINVDLPGAGAPSVVSDNRAGARALTDVLIDKMLARGNAPDELILLGGIAGEYATAMRIAGFRDAFAARGLPPPPDDAIECCGYAPAAARGACAALRHARPAAGRHANELDHVIRRARAFRVGAALGHLAAHGRRLLRLGPVRRTPAVRRHDAAAGRAAVDRGSVRAARCGRRRRRRAASGRDGADTLHANPRRRHARQRRRAGRLSTRTRNEESPAGPATGRAFRMLRIKCSPGPRAASAPGE